MIYRYSVTLRNLSSVEILMDNFLSDIYICGDITKYLKHWLLWDIPSLAGCRFLVYLLSSVAFLLKTNMRRMVERPPGDVVTRQDTYTTVVMRKHKHVLLQT